MHLPGKCVPAARNPAIRRRSSGGLSVWAPNLRDAALDRTAAASETRQASFRTLTVWSANGAASAARPSLRGLGWILILGKYLRVGSPRVGHLTQTKFTQTPFETRFFRRYLAGQFRGDQFVQGPKLVYRHRFEIMTFHIRNSVDSSLSQRGIGQLRNATPAAIA
jgi:hypothetical protein